MYVETAYKAILQLKKKKNFMLNLWNIFLTTSVILVNMSKIFNYNNNNKYKTSV